MGLEALASAMGAGSPDYYVEDTGSASASASAGPARGQRTDRRKSDRSDGATQTSPFAMIGKPGPRISQNGNDLILAAHRTAANLAGAQF